MGSTLGFTVKSMILENIYGIISRFLKGKHKYHKLKRFVIEVCERIELELKFLVGYKIRKYTHDRIVLEQSIIPFFVSKDDFRSILFVGCDWFTLHYKEFFITKEYWTMDIDKTKRRFGSKMHIVDALKNLSHHFSDNYFDVIIVNGVIGWGLNDRKDIEESLDNCFRCLRKKGVLVVGWNDIPERRPFYLEELQSLRKFMHYHFEPLYNWRYLTKNPNRHTFDFYIK